jgi:hypothetical protein
MLIPCVTFSVIIRTILSSLFCSGYIPFTLGITGKVLTDLS